MATLLGEWGFLDNLADTSGNGHTGTATGGFTYVTGPQANTKGIQFNGQTDFVDFGRTGLEPTADGLVIMGWIKSNTVGSNWLGLLTKARAAGSTRHRIGTSQTRNPAYVARWKDDIHTNDAITPVFDTGWHHLAMVDGNTKWALYIDGVVVSGHNGTRALTNGTSPVWEAFNWITGRNNTLGDQNADSTMAVSGIRIFQGEMTATEITTWMNTPVTGIAAATGGYEARSSTGMRYKPHVLLGGSPVEMSFNPQPVQLKDWAQFPTTSTLSANYNNATLPAGSGSAVTIPGWTISTTSLPMRAAYYMKVKPTYEFDTVTATPDTTVGVYRQPNTAMEGTVTLAAQQIPLGGTRYRSDPAPKTLSIAFGVSDPAVSVTYEARLYASVAGANLYMPAGGSYMTFLPCVLDAVSDTDKTVNARRTSMWNHRLIETNTDLFNITSSGITLLTPTAGGGWVMRITYTLVCSVSIPSITFGISRSDGFWGNSQAAAITTPVGDGTFKYTGVIDCTPASFASNTLAFPAIGVNPAAPVTLKAGCRIQIIAP